MSEPATAEWGYERISNRHPNGAQWADGFTSRETAIQAAYIEAQVHPPFIFLGLRSRVITHGEWVPEETQEQSSARG